MSFVFFKSLVIILIFCLFLCVLVICLHVILCATVKRARSPGPAVTDGCEQPLWVLRAPGALNLRATSPAWKEFLRTWEYKSPWLPSLLPSHTTVVHIWGSSGTGGGPGFMTESGWMKEERYLVCSSLPETHEMGTGGGGTTFMFLYPQSWKYQRRDFLP